MAKAHASAVGAAPTSITRLTSRVPLPIVLMVLSFLCPTELSVYLAGLRLPPHRVALLILLPFALMRLVRRKYRLMLCDVLVLLYSAWTCTAYTVQGNETEGLGSVDIRRFPGTRNIDSSSQLDGGGLDSAGTDGRAVGAYREACSG